MSINRNARTETVEVLFNLAELVNLDALCKTLGIARSTYLRGLGNEQVRLNGSGAIRPVESLHCRGAPIASRASAGRSAVVRGLSKFAGSGGAGGAHRVLQL
jgi:hypothetical protein